MDSEPEGVQRRRDTEGGGSEPAAAEDAGARRRTELFGAAGGGFPGDLFGEDFDWAALAARLGCDGTVALVDIETCGLGDALIFLAGILEIDVSAETLRFQSILAADPAAEPALLRAAVDVLGAAARWVSFNGKSFDVPRLRKRAFRHGVPFPECDDHVDLLHEVRRRWRDGLPDCRFSTVERRLLGLERGPWDIPGREVPDRYWDFVTTGEGRWIEPIIEHNRRDVLAMAPLYGKVLGVPRSA